jgi:hypothetical protein
MIDNNSNTPPDWHEEVPLEREAPLTPEEFVNPYGVKYDARVLTSEVIIITEVKTFTEKAILVVAANPDTGELTDEWFPKKLCSNLSEDAGTMCVWNVFVNDNKPHLITDGE